MQRPNVYKDVPELGDVVVSTHALEQMDRLNIPQVAFEKTLLQPIRPDLPEGYDIVWRERNGIRLVVLLHPQPDRGAKLVKTVYRVRNPAVVKY